ncbi:hypothetical protein SAMN02745691_02100 [Parasporobacterium paucivorans DSM 15970]|uniref:Uncharacterized protein n=1 Tax=Parasporobacterium paucivorans DSM 15970 TaxID=1122934 RepID=A0A1M6JZK8_9FIRM|nr:hypothetical protein SAMN02745691_02100 [Parasporobacterium paucivorans DSM 15970]
MKLAKKNYLIGPEIYETYRMIAKIFMIIAAAGSAVGVTVDFIFNDKPLIAFLPNLISSSVSAAVGVFGAITLIFAIIERTASEETLNKLHKDLPPEDIEEKPAKAQKPFNKFAIIAGMVVTLLLMILFNQFIDLLRVYYTVNGTGQFVRVINIELFRTYLPYINVLLVLQLLLYVSKLIFGRWTYPLAFGNLLVNLLSLLLLFAILKNTDIIDSELMGKISQLPEEVKNVSEKGIRALFTMLKVIFTVIFALDTAEGFLRRKKGT